MSLTDKRIALTGTLVDVSRAAFKDKVAANGGIYVQNLDDAVDVLVVGQMPIASRVDKARRLGIQVVDQAGFDALAVAVAAPGDDADVPLAFEADGDLPPSVEVSPHLVRILDLGVPRRAPGPLTPSSELFAHYTYDGPTLRMLRFVARAVLLRQPCLLEGETASSKTSAILHLAALTGHEVVRINLNGQTDTSELVGRYVPNEDDVHLPVDELLEHLELLEEESQMILRRARADHRALSAVESQQIAANERIRPPPWRFQEGLVPQAMRKGWWVILDEVNLAEPPVLERLNSVLERDPTLVLTEGPGTRFGPGGDIAVHPDFRMFATMNPAEYQGRSVLSPAYKDRWVASWQAESPGEVEYRQMLDRVVFGRHPDVDVGGLRFAGGKAAHAPYHALGAVAGVDGFLSKLAALHTGLVRMATPSDGKAAALGASRRERYVFSRRALLAVLDGLGALKLTNPRTGALLGFADAPEAIAADALERAYLDRIRGDDDRARVVQLLRSLGLHRDGWLHRFEEQPPS
jgi:MoxR-like ATPase